MENEITKKEETALARPSERPRGFEEGTAKEDLIIPRMKLLQFMSPEVTEEPDKFKAGSILNSLTKEVLSDRFIPIFKFTQWIRFNPRDEKAPGYDPAFAPGAVIWRSTDPEDPKVISEGAFGENGEVPLATKFLCFFSYFPGVDMPIIVSFSKTSIKAGRRLLSLCKFANCDMFARAYKIKTVKETKDLGGTKATYYVLSVDPAGKPTEDEFAFAEGLWNDFHAKPVQVHEDDLAGEEGEERVPF